MTETMEEYKRLAEKALNEPDPKRSLELCEQALAMGRRLGFGDGNDEMKFKQTLGAE
jgi:hypothetical protein